jgi:hypothetical protein
VNAVKNGELGQCGAYFLESFRTCVQIGLRLRSCCRKTSGHGLFVTNQVISMADIVSIEGASIGCTLILQLQAAHLIVGHQRTLVTALGPKSR